MKDIWRVFRYLKYYPGNIAVNLLFNTLAVLFNMFTFIMIVPFVELLFGTSQSVETLPPFAFNQEYFSLWLTYTLARYKALYGLWPCLLAISGGYLAFSFLSNLCRYLAQFFISPMRNGITMRLRNDIYHHITILPVSYFTSQRKGDLISRMSNDIADIEWGVLTSVISLGKDPINIILFAAALIFISPRLFLYFLIIMPIAVWLIGLIGKSLRRNSAEGQNRLGQLFALLEESLAGIRTILSFGQEQRRINRFSQTNDDYARTMIRVAERRELSSPLSEILLTLGLVFILILGGMAVLNGEILSSVFILFIILFARLIPPVQSMVRVYNNLQKANAAAQRVFEVMDADEKIYEKKDAQLLADFQKEIVYRKVSFAYQHEGQPHPTYVLRDIDLVIPKGRTIAIVGPSGAGKTTLVDLLPRFYDCTSGEILIDGIPLPDLNINSLRAQIGLVSQNCILFNDTVANNIAFGRTDFTPEQVRQAARIAHADEFIEQMEEGYSTNIGDRGLNLSGGQRQRLSIARAVLKDPPILILDEATSALDTESEQAVQQALEHLMKGRTSIIIAHRLSTICHADEIIVMDKGHIVERGTHNQLLSLNGLYKKLIDMQSFATT
ncbi:MAG: ABC transporter ATP-binding protein [Bacteroidales bacterium]|nr:ABC transporter ATP-binding protein [Bacteroidales bacterium]MBR3985770.1 ABC transporter ATP-binding protein [Bacteroidales bacterium]